MLSIEEIREKLGDRNLAEMSRRLNITRVYLSAIRNGRVTPSYHMVERLSNYLQEKE